MDFFDKLAAFGFAWGFVLFCAGTFLRAENVGRYETAILTQRVALFCFLIGTISALFS